ncbi:MAG: TlpA family protein disulfide reductase [Chloroflexi bacterium]|nr:TlpA family protein disulfide reductase [Chloroflexota bacterium]
MPELEATYKKLKSRGLVVLGIDFGEDKAVVETAVREFGLSFPVLLDTYGQVNKTYRTDVTGHPAHYFIDKSGRIVDTRVGYTNEAQLTTRLSSLVE